MSHSLRLTITWLLLVVATSLAFFGEPAAGAHARTLILAVAAFKLERVASSFMELSEGPVVLHWCVRAGLFVLVFALWLALP